MPVAVAVVVAVVWEADEEDAEAVVLLECRPRVDMQMWCRVDALSYRAFSVFCSEAVLAPARPSVPLP